MIRVLRETASDPHEKLPWDKRRALNFILPPRARTGRTRLSSTESLVMAAGRANSNLRFLMCTCLRPPVLRLLCLESLEIPIG